MENQNNDMSKKPITNFPILPSIALAFALSPIFWLLRDMPLLGGVLFMFFLFSFFGILSTFMGLILGTIALLFRRKKYKGKMGLVFSIISILSPFVWLAILFMGYFDYIMSYK